MAPAAAAAQCQHDTAFDWQHQPDNCQRLVLRGGPGSATSICSRVEGCSERRGEHRQRVLERSAADGQYQPVQHAGTLLTGGALNTLMLRVTATCVVLSLQDICPGSDEVIIVTSSLMKDMNSKVELYRCGQQCVSGQGRAGELGQGRVSCAQQRGLIVSSSY